MDTIPLFKKNSAVLMSNPSAAYVIFHKTYSVAVPKIHLLSNIELYEVGMSSTGDKKKDTASLTEEITAGLTIARMTELHYDGVDISVTNPNDTVEIYKLIKQHLHDWEKELGHSVNRRSAPIEGLLAFDDFASVLWDVAKFYAVERIYVNSLMQMMARISSNRVLHRRLENQQVAIQDPVSASKHDPRRSALLTYSKSLKEKEKNNDY